MTHDCDDEPDRYNEPVAERNGQPGWRAAHMSTDGGFSIGNKRNPAEGSTSVCRSALDGVSRHPTRSFKKITIRARPSTETGGTHPERFGSSEPSRHCVHPSQRTTILQTDRKRTRGE